MSVSFVTHQVPYGKYVLSAYITGSGEKKLFLLNGGPGLPCDYLREPHLSLAGKDCTVIAYDQLGTGASSCPDDELLWTIERYVEEVEHVRKSLGLGKINLLGHSWGSVLSIEYALTYPDNIETLILTDGTANIPHHLKEVNRLRAALGPETVAMMQRHEAQKTTNHEEYKAAVTLLDRRHVCRLDIWPEVFVKSIEQWNMEIFRTMQGENEYYFTGNLAKWNREEDLCKIVCKVLMIQGMHDMLTPAEAIRMDANLPDSKVVVFKNSGHLPVFEEPEEYLKEIKSWLLLETASPKEEFLQ